MKAEISDWSFENSDFRKFCRSSLCAGFLGGWVCEVRLNMQFVSVRFLDFRSVMSSCKLEIVRSFWIIRACRSAMGGDEFG